MPGDKVIHGFLLFYTGISFFALFYWLIIFIYSKRANYLILTLATAAQALYSLYEFRVIINLQNLDHVLLGFVTITFCTMASELNDFRKNLHPIAFYSYVGIIAAIVVFEFLSPIFLSSQLALSLCHVLILFANIIVASLFIYLWLAKHKRTARFAFFVYLPAMTGYIIFALTKLKILPSQLAILSPLGFTLFLLLLFYGMVTYVIALRKKREKEHLEKEELIRQQNIILQQKIEERTNELEIERKRSEDLLIQASQKQMAELELQSLRAQLNPHFMFNCLNAIQELILKEDFENSQTYLARFAKLLRMLVENTEKPFTSLQKEIDFLELYLSLEKLRLPDLQFSVTTDPSINKDETLIPNMILQPYIENALWHGLSPKSSDRKLEVSIQKQNGNVVYDVKDNGVGRKRSAELKTFYRKGHKSKGVELLAKRFKLLSEEFGSDITAEVMDVMNNGEACGTEVTIIVPDSLSQNYQNDLL